MPSHDKEDQSKTKPAAASLTAPRLIVIPSYLLDSSDTEEYDDDNDDVESVIDNDNDKDEDYDDEDDEDDEDDDDDDGGSGGGGRDRRRRQQARADRRIHIRPKTDQQEQGEGEGEGNGTGAAATTALQRWDVRLGRGNGIAQFSGNVFFREVVCAHKPEYNRAGRHMKRRVAERVIEIIAGRGGRFVEDGDGGDDGGGVGADGVSGGCRRRHRVVSREKAIEKTCQALREKKNNLPKRTQQRPQQQQQQKRRRSSAGADRSLRGASSQHEHHDDVDNDNNVGGGKVERKRRPSKSSASKTTTTTKKKKKKKTAGKKEKNGKKKTKNSHEPQSEPRAPGKRLCDLHNEDDDKDNKSSNEKSPQSPWRIPRKRKASSSRTAGTSEVVAAALVDPGTTTTTTTASSSKSKKQKTSGPKCDFLVPRPSSLVPNIDSDSKKEANVISGTTADALALSSSLTPMLKKALQTGGRDAASSPARPTTAKTKKSNGKKQKQRRSQKERQPQEQPRVVFRPRPVLPPQQLLLAPDTTAPTDSESSSSLPGPAAVSPTKSLLDRYYGTKEVLSHSEDDDSDDDDEHKEDEVQEEEEAQEEDPADNTAGPNDIDIVATLDATEQRQPQPSRNNVSQSPALSTFLAIQKALHPGSPHDWKRRQKNEVLRSLYQSRRSSNAGGGPTKAAVTSPLSSSHCTPTAATPTASTAAAASAAGFFEPRSPPARVSPSAVPPGPLSPPKLDRFTAHGGIDAGTGTAPEVAHGIEAYHWDIDGRHSDDSEEDEEERGQKGDSADGRDDYGDPVSFQNQPAQATATSATASACSSHGFCYQNPSTVEEMRTTTSGAVGDEMMAMSFHHNIHLEQQGHQHHYHHRPGSLMCSSVGSVFDTTPSWQQQQYPGYLYPHAPHHHHQYQGDDRLQYQCQVFGEEEEDDDDEGEGQDNDTSSATVNSAVSPVAPARDGKAEDDETVSLTGLPSPPYAQLSLQPPPELTTFAGARSGMAALGPDRFDDPVNAAIFLHPRTRNSGGGSGGSVGGHLEDTF